MIIIVDYGWRVKKKEERKWKRKEKEGKKRTKRKELERIIKKDDEQFFQFSKQQDDYQ